MEQILDLFLQFGQLMGVAACIAALINVFKTFGLVKDGTAGKWSAALNLIALAALVALRLFAPQIALEQVDAQAAMLSQILLIVLGYVVQLFGSDGVHALFARLRLPVIGKSHAYDEYFADQAVTRSDGP